MALGFCCGLLPAVEGVGFCCGLFLLPAVEGADFCFGLLPAVEGGPKPLGPSGLAPMVGAMVLTAWRGRAATLATPGRGGRSTSPRAEASTAVHATIMPHARSSLRSAPAVPDGEGSPADKPTLVWTLHGNADCGRDMMRSAVVK